MDPEDVFAVHTYTGNGDAIPSQIGWRPSMVWTKLRRPSVSFFTENGKFYAAAGYPAEEVAGPCDSLEELMKHVPALIAAQKLES